MACRLEVVCETRFGETVAVVGGDRTLGEWDLTRALELQTDSEAFPVWSGSVAVPPPGTEFKFVVLPPAGLEKVCWEPLACNRRWPPEVSSEGSAVLAATFGEGGLRVLNAGLGSEAIVCASCPDEWQQEVAHLCKANKIMKAFGRWNGIQDGSFMVQACREWVAQVITAVVGLVHEREAHNVRIICIEGGPWVSVQKAKQPHLLHAVCSELGDPSFPVSVTWMTLSSFKGEFGRRASGQQPRPPGTASPPEAPRLPPTPCPDAAPAADEASPADSDVAAGGGGGLHLRDAGSNASTASSTPTTAIGAECQGNKAMAVSAAAGLARLAQELYGQGSDEAALVAKNLGVAGWWYFDKDQCEYYDLSPEREEDGPGKAHMSLKKKSGGRSRINSSSTTRRRARMAARYLDAPKASHMGRDLSAVRQTGRRRTGSAADGDSNRVCLPKGAPKVMGGMPDAIQAA